MRRSGINLKKVINFRFKIVTLNVKNLQGLDVNSVIIIIIIIIIIILLMGRTKIFGKVNHLLQEETQNINK